MKTQVIYKTNKGQLGEPYNPRYVVVYAEGVDDIVNQINVIDEFGIIEYVIIDDQLHIVQSVQKTINRLDNVNDFLLDAGIEK